MTNIATNSMTNLNSSSSVDSSVSQSGYSALQISDSKLAALGTITNEELNEVTNDVSSELTNSIIKTIQQETKGVLGASNINIEDSAINNTIDTCMTANFCTAINNDISITGKGSQDIEARNVFSLGKCEFTQKFFMEQMAEGVVDNTKTSIAKNTSATKVTNEAKLDLSQKSTGVDMSALLGMMMMPLLIIIGVIMMIVVIPMLIGGGGGDEGGYEEVGGGGYEDVVGNMKDVDVGGLVDGAKSMLKMVK
eukprot:Pgem_evm12s4769